jgi:hypothetical protein
MKQHIKFIFLLFFLQSTFFLYSQKVNPVLLSEWEKNDLNRNDFLVIGERIYFFEYNTKVTKLFVKNQKFLKFLNQVNHNIENQERIGLFGYKDDSYVVVFNNEIQIINIYGGNIVKKFQISSNNLKFTKTHVLNNHELILSLNEILYSLNLETQLLTKITFSKLSETKIFNGKLLKISQNDVKTFDIESRQENVLLNDSTGLVNIIVRRITDQNYIAIIGKSKFWIVDDNFSITNFDCKINNVFGDFVYQDNKIFYISKESFYSESFFRVVDANSCQLIFEQRFDPGVHFSFNLIPYFINKEIEMIASTPMQNTYINYVYDIESNTISNSYINQRKYISRYCDKMNFFITNITIALQGYKIQLTSLDDEKKYHNVELDDNITHLNMSPCVDNSILLYTNAAKEKLYMIEFSTSAIQEEENNLPLFYPTLNNGNLIVNQKTKEITLHDLNGKVISVFKNIDEGENISFHVPSGLYILKFAINDKVITKKLIIGN